MNFTKCIITKETTLSEAIKVAGIKNWKEFGDKMVKAFER